MPVSLAALRKVDVALEVEYLGQSIHFSYSPSRIDDDLLKQSREATAKVGSRATIPQLLALLKSWDITEDGATTLPISEQTLEDIGPVLRGRIIRRIMEDAYPELGKGTAS